MQKPFKLIYSMQEQNRFHMGDLVISGHYIVEDRKLEAFIDEITSNGHSVLNVIKNACDDEIPEKYIINAAVHCEKMEGIDRFEDTTTDNNQIPDYEAQARPLIRKTLQRLAS